jgi:hypothetical protein
MVIASLKGEATPFHSTGIKLKACWYRSTDCFVAELLVMTQHKINFHHRCAPRNDSAQKYLSPSLRSNDLTINETKKAL